MTIAANKGHHKFVELLLRHGAAVDVRNKKGATPLWLACHHGHLEVVQLLITHAADPDSQDSRKVSCLMAAFREGNLKVVKYLVRYVRQFPSDSDCRRWFSTITDKVESFAIIHDDYHHHCGLFFDLGSIEEMSELSRPNHRRERTTSSGSKQSGEQSLERTRLGEVA